MTSLEYIGCLFVVLLTACVQKGLGSQDEVRLVNHLFDRNGYNPLIRPVANLNETISVKFGLAMIQLISVNEKSQVLKSNVWLRMTWKDFQFQWDPADYGAISVIRIQPDKVWKPDIVLFNNADGKYEVSWEPNILIFDDSSVLWIPPAIYKSSCTIDVKYFPFDEQDCKMNFGSWTFDASEVSLGWFEGKRQIDLNDYVHSGTWDIVGVPGQVFHFQDREGINQTKITFTLKIRRKTLFYTVNLIIPCVLISFLSVCVFYLPADAGEKMTLCISILLALVVFLLLVSKILPPTSISIPLISKYLLFTFNMNVFTIVITVIIINWSFRTPRTHRMPRWARLLFLNWLPKILLMQRPDHNQRAKEKKCNKRLIQQQMGGAPDKNPMRQYSSINSRGDIVELSDMQNCRPMGSKGPSLDNIGRNDSADSGTDNSFRLTPELHKAIEGVRFIHQHLVVDDEYNAVREDWKYIAMVIDRLLLIIFAGVTIGGTVGIIINAPHIFEFVDQDEIIEKIEGAGTNGT